MLKFNYESKSEIPSGLESFYTEKDGGFALEVEGAKTNNDVQTVKDALDKERALRRDAEKKNTEYESKYSLLPDDFDINEFNNLQDKSAGDVDAKLKDQRDRLTTQGAKELAALQTQLDEARGLVKTHVTDASLSRAINEVGIAKQYTPAVEALMRGRVTLEGSEVYLDEKPISEAMKAWSQSDEGKHYVAAGDNTGGGSNTANGGKNAAVTQMARSDYMALPSAKKVELSKAGVELTE